VTADKVRAPSSRTFGYPRFRFGDLGTADNKKPPAALAGGG
jgi:hypothetical protein